MNEARSSDQVLYPKNGNRALWINLLRRDYLEEEGRRYTITEACVILGHPAKNDKPYELKTDWQRGCVCGRNPYA